MGDDARLRVLFVAFYFPPTSGGGVERTLKFLQYLPDSGVDAEALVPTDAKWLAEDPASLSRIPAGLTVHRVPFRGPSRRVLPGERIARANGRMAKLRVRAALAPQRLLVPDADAPWLVDVVPAAVRLIRSGRFDALVTTAPPHSLALAGAAIAERTGIPWIHDFRDPWTTHPDLDLGRASVRWKNGLSRGLERWALRRMDGAVAVGGADAEVAAMRPGLPLALIPNGVDFDELPRLAAGSADPGHLTFCFAGYLFGDRDPAAFLRGLAAAIAEQPALAELVRVRFLGGVLPRDTALIERLGLGGQVAVEGSRPRAEALAAQAGSDVLLLFMQDAGGRGREFVPQKTWEYIAAARPILAFVPTEGASARVLREHAEAVILDQDDAEGAKAAILALVDRRRRGTLSGREPDPALRDAISRQRRAADLAAFLRRIVAAAR